MNLIIQKLNQDHHRLAELLNVLDEQMDLLDSDIEFDSELTLGVLEYIKYYPDVFHHPLEELIFDRSACSKRHFTTRHLAVVRPR